MPTINDKVFGDMNLSEECPWDEEDGLVFSISAKGAVNVAVYPGIEETK